jgi:hypothetical protein
MRIRYLVVLALAVNLTPSLRAQNPDQARVSKGVSYSSGQNCEKKGWYLYWPEQALMQPRLPMPYPWWPNQQGAPAIPPAEQSVPSGRPAVPQAGPSAPLFLPRDTQGLPALPGPMSQGQPFAPPVQPVSFYYPSYAAPGYWYGR